MRKLLENWKAALDRQIGDTDSEIQRRRESNADAVRVREEVEALDEYMRTVEMPDIVRSAIERCLSWNPYCKT